MLNLKAIVFICTLYVFVSFVPDLGGIDVMGAQWFYISCLNGVMLLYLFFLRNHYKEALNQISELIFSKIYILFFVWSFVSCFYAINGIETLVCFVRLSNTFLVFYILSILLYKQDLIYIFKKLSYVVTLVLLYDSLFILVSFSKNLNSLTLDQNILNIVGNYGNKNVLAASLLIKLPFCIYLLQQTKYIFKIYNLLVLTLSILTLFLLNTRSTFIGLFFLTIIYLLFVTKTYWNTKRIMFIKCGLFLIPFIIAFQFSNILINTANQLNENENGSFGTVENRISTIQFSNSSSNGRLQYWNAAFDYFIKHPFLGCGYGNWKLASIPYDKEISNDLFVPYHAHNDFLEIGAELGIIGCGLFIGLFIILFMTIFRILTNNKHISNHLDIVIFFFPIICYCVDAIFNFPSERPTMQVFWALTCVIILAISYNFSSLGITKSANIKEFKTYNYSNSSKVFIFLSILSLPLNIYISERTYNSFIYQKSILIDSQVANQISVQEILDNCPTIPNLAVSTIPIKALLAKYCLVEKKYDQAITLLNKSDHDNPYLFYNDFIRTSVYSEMDKRDSAFYFSKTAFYNKPRASSYYTNLLYAAAKVMDSSELNNAFKTYIKYRNSAEAWNQYYKAMLEVKGNGIDLINRFDKAFVLFPENTNELLKTKDLLLNYNRYSSIVDDTTSLKKNNMY